MKMIDKERLAIQLFGKEHARIAAESQEELQELAERSAPNGVYASGIHLSKHLRIMLATIRKLGRAKLNIDKRVFFEGGITSQKDADFLYNRVLVVIRGQGLKRYMKETHVPHDMSKQFERWISEIPSHFRREIDIMRGEDALRAEETAKANRMTQEQLTKKEDKSKQQETGKKLEKSTECEVIEPQFDEQSGELSFGNKHCKLLRESMQYKLVEFLYDNPNIMHSYGEIAIKIGLLEKSASKTSDPAKWMKEIEQHFETQSGESKLIKAAIKSMNNDVGTKKKIIDLVSEINKKLKMKEEDKQQLFECNQGYRIRRKITPNTSSKKH